MELRFSAEVRDPTLFQAAIRMFLQVQIQGLQDGSTLRDSARRPILNLAMSLGWTRAFALRESRISTLRYSSEQGSRTTNGSAWSSAPSSSTSLTELSSLPPTPYAVPPTIRISAS